MAPNGNPTANAAIYYAAFFILYSVSENLYSHLNFVQNSTYFTDCSGILTHILSKTNPLAVSSFPIEAGHNRPRAISYYNAITYQAPHWQHIFNLVEARAGDILAWRTNIYNPRGNSGHVAIIMEPPVQITENIYRITVFDSSLSQNGISTRDLIIKTNENGEPIAFWSKSRGKFMSKPLAIGRVYN